MKLEAIAMPISDHLTSDHQALPLTVIVPAFNEAAHLADALRSLLEQTHPPERIIVVDDCSTDGTGDVARSLGDPRIDVIRAERNTGSKAMAQNLALPQVTTLFAMSVDADTRLDPEALNHIFAAMADPSVAAACGFVVPKRVWTIWERGRYVEYLASLHWHKRLQDAHGKPVVASGCFCLYRTDRLREMNGWSQRTVAEDMDLTWSLHAAGHGVRFVPEAVCYPVEPDTWRMMRTQLRRWTHGFVQNAALHRTEVLRTPVLRLLVGAALLDAVLAFLVLFLVVPVLAVLQSPWWLLVYVWDLPLMAVPLLAKAWQRGEMVKALVSLPCYLPLRMLNAWCSFEAIFTEWVLRRRLTVFEKGHAEGAIS